jgi:hypothetical protein
MAGLVRSDSYVNNANNGAPSFPFGLNASGGQITNTFVGSRVVLEGGNGFGSSNTNVRRYSTVVEASGADMSYADSATAGGSITINSAGLYLMVFTDAASTAPDMGITKNSTGAFGTSAGPSTNMAIFSGTVNNGNIVFGSSAIRYLAVNDVIRVNTDSTTGATTNNSASFQMHKIF